jgi:hypothetical protein
MVYFTFSEMPTNHNREAIIALHHKEKTKKKQKSLADSFF